MCEIAGIIGRLDEDTRSSSLQPALSQWHFSGCGGPSSTGHPECIGLGSGLYMSDGATGMASSDEAAVQGAP